MVVGLFLRLLTHLYQPLNDCFTKSSFSQKRLSTHVERDASRHTSLQKFLSQNSNLQLLERLNYGSIKIWECHEPES